MLCKVKLNFSKVKFQCAQIKLNFAPIKLNFTQIKFIFEKLKFNFPSDAKINFRDMKYISHFIYKYLKNVQL